MGHGTSSHRQAYALVVLAAGSYTCLMFVWFSLPAFLSTIIAELDLSSTQAGVLAGAVPLTYIPLALFSGLAVDRVGPGRSLAVGVLIYGVAQIVRSTADGFPSLLATTLFLGVGATAITFGLPKLVGVLFPPEATGRPSAIYLIGASAGSALVFAVGRPVLGPWLGGWRPLFFWSGVVAVGYGLCWLLVTWRVDIDGRMAATDSFSLKSVVDDLRLVLAHRELRLVVVIGTMYLLLHHGLQGWLPTVLESRGFSAAVAGQATSLLIGAYVVGVLVVPTLADRFTARRLALMSCGSIAFLGVVGMIMGGKGGAVAVGIIFAGFGIGGVSPLIRAIPPALEGIGARLTGTAVGFIFAVGEIGGFFGPMLIGVFHDVTGSFIPGLVMLSAGALVVVLAGAMLRYERR